MSGRDKKLILISGVLCLLFLSGVIWRQTVAADEENEGMAEGTVVINEVMWMGSGGNTSDEWIELRNLTDEGVDLTGWTIARAGSGEAALLLSGTIEPAGYFLITKKTAEESALAGGVMISLASSAMSLANSPGEQLVLQDGGGAIVDQMPDNGWPAGENGTVKKSMERNDPPADGMDANDWHTCSGEEAVSETFWKVAGVNCGTPGEANSVPPENHAPEADITGPESASVGEEVSFSAGDSTDEDGDELIYVWLFGDGASGEGEEVTHTYNQTGDYTVKLTVGDGLLENEAEHKIEVSKIEYSDDVVISELLPNPEGLDTAGEFIELYNKGNKEIDLGGWKLTDGSRTYIIPAGEKIVESGFWVADYGKSKISLGNSGDEVRLLAPDETEKSSVSYGAAAEGQSYNLTDGGNYAWSTTVTKGEKNVITVEEDEEEDEDEEKAADDEDKKEEAAKVITLEEVRNEPLGSKVVVEGVVSVPPGVLGKTVMYLAGSGIQLYFSKGDWPDFRLGDRVRAEGVVSASGGEARIKLADKQEIIKIKQEDAPEAHQMETGAIGEDTEGWLVTVSGEVVETSGSTFYLDDGSGEVKVYIKPDTGINKPKMKKGMTVTVTGVVSETSSGYRILPRFQEDVIAGQVAGASSFPQAGWEMGWPALFLEQRRMIVPIGVVLLVLVVLAERAGEPLIIKRKI
ncbi:MAG: lamin tail domain-containing protein [bacterium]|nr:lamin tail domain-containing protein [bacterium]